MTIMAAILAGFLMVALFVGPLVARIIFDRRAERASVVAADLRAAVRRRLGGESMVSVHVRPEGIWLPGRVLLSAPTGYEDLVEKVWPALARRIPAGHELVVRSARTQPARLRPQVAPLSRAA